MSPPPPELIPQSALDWPTCLAGAVDLADQGKIARLFDESCRVALRSGEVLIGRDGLEAHLVTALAPIIEREPSEREAIHFGEIAETKLGSTASILHVPVTIDDDNAAHILATVARIGGNWLALSYAVVGAETRTDQAAVF